MKNLTKFLILIFSNLMIAPIIQLTEQPSKAIFYVGLVIFDILGLIVIFRSMGNDGSI